MLTLIKNARIYAPQLRGERHLLVGGGRILWMGQEELELAPNLRVDVHDADGQRLIPGFIDGHAHVTGGGGESGFASRVPPVGLSQFACNGITTVVGLLGTDDTTRNTQSLLAQTRALREQGINAYCYTGGYRVPPMTLTGCVRSDIVNIDAVIGVGELAISDHRSSQPSFDEFLRVASDAHVAGMISGKAGIVHIHLGDGSRGLELVRRALDETELPARVFNPTHVNRRRLLFEEACALAKRGCYVDLTAFPIGEEDDAFTAADGLVRYLDSGAPAHQITISSDGGGCLPHFDADGRITHMGVGKPAGLADTLAELLRRGHELDTVLPAFTSNPAKLLRLSRKGSIACGQDADLVLLADDHSIASVLIDGIWHRRDGQQLIFGNFEQ